MFLMVKLFGYVLLNNDRDTISINILCSKLQIICDMKKLFCCFFR